jgi:NADPH:quinone reductase-like Zn-dependent oxidoreductase
VISAGIREIGGPVVTLQLDEPAALADDEVLIEVKAAGVGNWDDIARTGGWDLGVIPPMALGVEAAGVVVRTGAGVGAFPLGDAVLAHTAPLRYQGAWAEHFVAPADSVAPKPSPVSWEEAAAFPVPALTAQQVLTVVLSSCPGGALVVHGAGGVTGQMIVQLAALDGRNVIATAGSGAGRPDLAAMGARAVIDRHAPGWKKQVRTAAGAAPVTAVVNAVRGGATEVMDLLADQGVLVTITSGAPAPVRGIAVIDFYVRPDGRQLCDLARLLASGKLRLPVGTAMPLGEAARALAGVSTATLAPPVVLIP